MTNRLAQHIEQLLLRHRCAVLPSLGGFVLENRPARFDAYSLLAYPPSIAIYFHEGLTHQDGLVAESYAKLYGVSLRRARIMVEDDVRRLRQELVRQGYFILEGIGTLHLNAEGRVSFTDQPSSRLNSPSYGLSPVALPELLPMPVPTPLSEENSISPAVAHRYIHLRIPKRALGYAAAVAVVLLALLPWGQWTSQREESFTASFVPTETAVKTILGTEPEAPQIAEVSTVESATPSPWVEATPGRYYVIIASEHSDKRAQSHYDSALEAGYPELRILRGKKTHRVSAASFASETEAYTYLKSITNQVREAWVYRQR